MHTDEYEISLSRELAVCDHAIKSLVRAFCEAGGTDGFEAEVVLEQCRAGTYRNTAQDSALSEQCAALERWIERRKQYEELLRLMKL